MGDKETGKVPMPDGRFLLGRCAELLAEGKDCKGYLDEKTAGEAVRLKNCSGQEAGKGYYFELGDDAFAFCGRDSPFYVLKEITHSGGPACVSTAPYSPYKAGSGVVYPSSHDSVYPASNDSWNNSQSRAEDGISIFEIGSNRSCILGICVDKKKEYKPDTVITGGFGSMKCADTLIELKDFDISALESAGLVIDRIIIKGLEAAGLTEIDEQRLASMAGGGDKKAEALLDAVRVRDYIKARMGLLLPIH